MVCSGILVVCSLPRRRKVMIWVVGSSIDEGAVRATFDVERGSSKTFRPVSLRSATIQAGIVELGTCLRVSMRVERRSFVENLPSSERSLSISCPLPILETCMACPSPPFVDGVHGGINLKGFSVRDSESPSSNGGIVVVFVSETAVQNMSWKASPSELGRGRSGALDDSRGRADVINDQWQ